MSSEPHDTVVHPVDGTESPVEIPVDRRGVPRVFASPADDAFFAQGFAIGRGHRMLMLERLIDYFEAHDGVVFESLGDYVRRWKAANPLYAGKTG